MSYLWGWNLVILWITRKLLSKRFKFQTLFLFYTRPEEFIINIQENGLKHASGRLYLVAFDLLYSSMDDVDNNVLTANRRKLIEVISTFEAKDDKIGSGNSYLDKLAAEMDGTDVYDRTKY